MIDDVAEEAEVGGHALDAALGQCRAELCGGFCERAPGPMHNELGQQRVEVRIDCQARISGRVHAHTRACRKFDHVDGAATWFRQTARLDRFGVDTSLDRPAPNGGRFGEIEIRQRCTLCKAELRGHNIDTADFFGDGVLDLDAGVGLDKPELRRVVGVDKELDGAHARVGNRSAELDRCSADLVTDLGGQVGRRRNFDDLLVASLHAAVTLAEVGDGAAVAHDLDLDMSRSQHELLDIDVASAEGLGGFRDTTVPCWSELVGGTHRAHAATAASGDRFQHDCPMGFEQGPGFVDRGRPWAAGEYGQSGCCGSLACGDLVTEEAEHLWGWPDEGDPCGCARSGQVRILCEEAVAGMDGVDPIGGRCCDDRLDV